jgi:hypothetical protein
MHTLDLKLQLYMLSCSGQCMQTLACCRCCHCSIFSRKYRYVVNLNTIYRLDSSIFFHSDEKLYDGFPCFKEESSCSPVDSSGDDFGRMGYSVRCECLSSCYGRGTCCLNQEDVCRDNNTQSNMTPELYSNQSVEFFERRSQARFETCEKMPSVLSAY